MWAPPRPHLWHGKIVHKDRHLLASWRPEVLTPTLVELHLDGVLTHEWRCRAREVDPAIHNNIKVVGGGGFRTFLVFFLGLRSKPRTDCGCKTNSQFLP